MMRGTRRVQGSLMAVLTAVVATGCGGDAGPGDAWAGAVTDSAGVAIVSNPAEGLWGGTPAWEFVEEYRVGGMDAETEAQFGQVAPIGIDLDADGNVYVADTQQQTLRVFGPDGTFLRSIGTPGQGPGEIGLGMVAAFVVGDEVWAADVGNMRVGRWSLDGTMQTPLPLDLTAGVPIRWDELSGDRVVIQLRGMDFTGEGTTPENDALVYFDGAIGDTLALLPAGQSFQMTGGVPQFRFFEAEPVWDATSDGRVMSAMNSDYRIEVRSADGTLERIVTLAHEPRPVTEGDERAMTAAIRDLMADQGAPPQAVEMIMSQATFADVYPAFAQMLAGPEGTLWVQRIATAAELGESDDFDMQNLGSDLWDIFDAEGRYLGEMTMPAKFTPVRVDGDAFWGIQRDEFDVQSVVRYRLQEVG
ncbi:MAG: hypothetical protein KJO11_04440 [Gemmatimonadetes bacterium]|nr:hypothetical protein [Gemmatimonadota bacterium]MBT8403323.1 hypothetical protein [Gemmatimonadota bacterium]